MRFNRQGHGTRRTSCHHSEQCLSGAYVARRFVTADVLLARLQRHAQSLATTTVLACTDDAARKKAAVLRGTEERSVRSTVAHGYTESLAIPNADITFARRRQKDQ